jgi:EAL domain-containing protein (putative c-di-GMP-specific phosphodiesterase class I)
MEKLILGLNLVDSDRFVDKFGPEVVDVVEEDITEDFSNLAIDLLSRHQICSGVVNPVFGCWHVTFCWEEGKIPISENEQMESITQAGEVLVREKLQEELGMATGTSIDFELGIYSLDQASDDLSNESKCNLITKQKSKKSYAKSDREKLLEIIEEKLIDIHLQAIMDLGANQIVGFEALARGPEGSSLYRAADLFGTAAKHGLTEELELACVEEAIELLADLPQPYWLAINLGPDLLTADRLKEIVEELRIEESSRVIFELTEHLPILENCKLDKMIDFLDQKEIKLSLDDTGCGFANLEVIEKLRPKIVKLCITVVNRITREAKIKNKIKEIVNIVNNLDGDVLGEGIEKNEQLQDLHEAGVKYGQGYYFSKPLPAGEVIYNINSKEAKSWIK